MTGSLIIYFNAQCFFQSPLVPPVRLAMAVRREKAAAKLPEPRPDLFAVSLRDFQRRDFIARKKTKAPFSVRRREGFQFHPDLEKKHEPVRLAVITVFADQPGQMQI